MSELTLDKLQELVRTGVAIRSRVTLQPAGGEGTKVFPPTYARAVYAMEKRRLPGYPEPVDCVLLDSVQSQANRMEEALQQAVDEKRIEIPVVEVDFTSFFPGTDKDEALRLLEPVGMVTSLQAPHRIVDAILRDSLVEEEVEENGEKKKRYRPFRGQKDESTVGQRLRRVTAQNATALFELCPTALLFGMWDSTGPKGGLGAKFERAIVSEIVGINAVRGCRTSSRLDPLGIQLQAGPVYQTPEGGWTLDPENAKKEEKGQPVKLGKDGRPSEANHGNVTPSISGKDSDGEFLAGGVTIDRAEQTIVLSFPALRRLNFPIEIQENPKGKTQADTPQEQINVAARTVLAALGLCAATLAAEAGLDLRSRCLLWPTEPLKWELLGRPGEIEKDIVVTAEQSIQLLKEAIRAATQIDLPWRTEPLRLQPSDELVKLVVKSQQLAMQQGGEGGK